MLRLTTLQLTQGFNSGSCHLIGVESQAGLSFLICEVETRLST